MIIFLYGPDTYRSHQKLQGLIKKYVDASAGDMNLAILEGRELTVQQFSQQVQAMPFLANSRLVVIKNLLLEGKKDVAEIVLDQLDTVPSATNLVLYESGQPDKRTKLYGTLLKLKQVQEFPLLTGFELERFAQQAAADRGLAVSNAVLQLLLRRTGANLWQLTNELEKLSLYGSATQQPITEALVNQLTTDNTEFKVFDLTDAFGARQGDKALQLLQKANADESLGTLALIAGQYRNLLLIAEGIRRRMPRQELARALGLHSFVFDKSYTQATQYDYEELVACYRYLLQVDIASKQSLFEPLAGLRILAATLKQKPLQLPDLSEEIMLQW